MLLRFVATPKKTKSIRRWCKQSEPEFLNFQGAQESIPRSQFRQAVQPGGPVNNPLPTRFLAPQRLFKNSSTAVSGGEVSVSF